MTHFETSLCLIGQASSNDKDTNNPSIKSKPHSFHRTSLQRFFFPLLYFFKLIKNKPNIIIMCTHELLFASLVYKLFFRAKLIYDIQEDYFKNCYYSNAYSKPLGLFLAYYVRLKEKTCARWISHFLLAEKIYKKDLNFIKNKYTTIENKSLYNPNLDNPSLRYTTNNNHSRKKVKLIITGTLSKKFGVFNALFFIEAYRKHVPNACLYIVGFAPLASEQEEIKEYIKTKPYIHAIGIDTIVPHEEIITLVSKSDLVLMPYALDKDTLGRIPTKLYEYLSLQKPMLIQKNKDWQKITDIYNAAVYIDFNDFDIQGILGELTNTCFYTKEVSDDIYWQSEEKKLIKALRPYYS